MTISLPSKAVICEIHKKQNEKFRGISFEPDHSKLNSALAWPRMMVTAGGGVDVFDVAVSLMSSIVSLRPFNQGNRRMGLTLCLMTLRRNGWVLDITNDEAFSLMAKLDDKNIEEKDIIKFCRDKSVYLGS
ncbi:MAG: Fic family protein [Sneathiella sp.]